MSDDTTFKAYMEHHDRCPTCIAAGQGRGGRCDAGRSLWRMDQDRWCWPTSNAMNTQEIDVFEKRERRFGELLADRLVIRDRSMDARVSCGECAQGKEMVCADRIPKPWHSLNHCHAFKAGPFAGDLPVVRRFAKPVRQVERAENF